MPNADSQTEILFSSLPWCDICTHSVLCLEGSLQFRGYWWPRGFLPGNERCPKHHLCCALPPWRLMLRDRCLGRNNYSLQSLTLLTHGGHATVALPWWNSGSLMAKERRDKNWQEWQWSQTPAWSICPTDDQEEGRGTFRWEGAVRAWRTPFVNVSILCPPMQDRTRTIGQ